MHNSLENNQEAVFYCEDCLSLAIRVMDENDTSQDYCDSCGSTTISTTDIHTWEKMWEDKYGYNFLKQI